MHATAATLRSIPPTAGGSGLAVPSLGGGCASHTTAAAAAAAAPPLASALIDQRLGGLLLAESWPAQGVRFFYPRQSPPSRQCIKPFRPDRPGTSMRESSGEGPLPPGPPPAFCSWEEWGLERGLTRAHSTRTQSHTYNRTHFSPSHKLTHAVHTRVHTLSHTHVCAHSTLTLTHVHAYFTATYSSFIRAHTPYSHTLTCEHLHGLTHTRGPAALASPQHLPPHRSRVGSPTGNVPPTQP